MRTADGVPLTRIEVRDVTGTDTDWGNGVYFLGMVGVVPRVGETVVVWSKDWGAHQLRVVDVVHELPSDPQDGSTVRVYVLETP